MTHVNDFLVTPWTTEDVVHLNVLQAEPDPNAKHYFCEKLVCERLLEATPQGWNCSNCGLSVQSALVIEARGMPEIE